MEGKVLGKERHKKVGRQGRQMFLMSGRVGKRKQSGDQRVLLICMKTEHAL